MFGTVTYDTYLQTYALSVNEEMADTHITRFSLKRRDAKRIVKMLGYKSLKEFNNTYTYDNSERVYWIAKAENIIVKEWMEKDWI